MTAAAALEYPALPFARALRPPQSLARDLAACRERVPLLRGQVASLRMELHDPLRWRIKVRRALAWGAAVEDDADDAEEGARFWLAKWWRARQELRALERATAGSGR